MMTCQRIGVGDNNHNDEGLNEDNGSLSLRHYLLCKLIPLSSFFYGTICLVMAATVT
ncbi:hypothetical protein GYH30_013176 [Glycine max]|uniref:Uncharacterized protein n=1 Tax=Glycine max TaxID=3847 RepID=K7KR80_SOYBN|nr:hypothetical protein GYH30_013176 [Glycine max]